MAFNKPTFFSTLPPVYDAYTDPNFQTRLQRFQGSANNPYFGPGWDAVAGINNAQGGGPVNPYSTISNVKNPQVKSLLDKVLGSVDTAVGGPNSNPYMLRKNTLDQGQEARVQGLAGGLPAFQSQQNQSLADFTKNYMEGINQSLPYLRQETGAIGEYYDKGPEGVQARLDQLANRRQNAVAAAVSRALDRVKGQANLQRLNLGDSSYLDSQAMNTASDIMAREAIDQANLGRENYLTVKNAQNALSDRRRQLVDALAQMRLLPMQAGNAQQAANLSQLGAAGDLIRANNMYRVETPEDILARKLGVLGQASNLDLANTFYGVQKPYEPDYSGYAVNPYYAGGIRSPTVTPYQRNPYGYGNQYLPDSNIPQTANPVSLAYRNITGQNPATDRNISPELIQSLNAYYANGTGGMSPAWMQPNPYNTQEPYDFIDTVSY